MLPALEAQKPLSLELYLRAYDTKGNVAPVSGKVGVWSKTDSISEFADYAVTPAGK